MDKKLIRKWCKALRSGKYKQGKGKLRDHNDNFCCLGVLCDISGLGEWASTTKGMIYKIDNIPGATMLPRNLEKELHEFSIYQDDLAHMNDSGRSFQEIADYIDRLL